MIGDAEDLGNLLPIGETGLEANPDEYELVPLSKPQRQTLAL